MKNKVTNYTNIAYKIRRFSETLSAMMLGYLCNHFHNWWFMFLSVPILGIILSNTYITNQENN